MNDFLPFFFRENNCLLAVFIVVTPDFHKLISRKLFQLSGVGISVLSHKIRRLLQIQSLDLFGRSAHLSETDKAYSIIIQLCENTMILYGKSN